MTTKIESIDDATSRVLVGGVEAFRFTAQGVDKVQDGVITPAKLAPAAKPLGVGQTWQNMAASRFAGTTYTNSTGRTIDIYIGIANTSASGAFGGTLLHNGFNFYQVGTATGGGGSNVAGLTVRIPDGGTYSLTLTAASIANWLELR